MSDEAINVDLYKCCGERYIGCGASDKTITISGTPGNALGAFLDGANIIVNGNAQDAVGDTMNDGRIIIHGSTGDALGYGMRGGTIFVKGDSGYRTGIHMKQYGDKRPVIVIGGRTGSFLGEYLAGGLIIVLGMNCDSFPSGYFAGTGMHGGQMFIRSKLPPVDLPAQVSVKKAAVSDMASVADILDDYCSCFGINTRDLYDLPFYLLSRNSKNPYKQLYTAN